MTSSEASTRRRVKLYILNEERQWDDHGTGHVSAMGSGNHPTSLVVISETDGSVLLESRIQTDTAYQKQQETLIVWSEGESSDLALSFQEKTGCDDIWEKICTVQGKDPSVEITQELNDELEDNDEMDTTSPTPFAMSSNNGLELGRCDLAHLRDIADVFSSHASLRTQRDQLANSILDKSSAFLHQLVDVFHQAEDLDDAESLRIIHDIVKQMLALNHASLYGELFSSTFLMDIIGMLEYTPNGRKYHRDFFTERATFRDICDLQDKDLIDRIHQTYQVQYIQECCLSPPSLLDENSLHNLNNFVLQNKNVILRQILHNENLLRNLLLDLVCGETEEIRRRELTVFLRELCLMCNSLVGPEKDTFLQKFIHAGLGHAGSSSSLASSTANNKSFHSGRFSFASSILPSSQSSALSGIASSTTTANNTITTTSSSSSPSSSSSSSSASSNVVDNKASIGSINGISAARDSTVMPPGGMLGVLKRLLQSSDEVIRHSVLDILHVLVETHCNIVRDFLFHEEPSIKNDSDLLFNILTDQLIHDSDPECSYAMTISLMIRSLIDPDSMIGSHFTQLAEKTEFVSFLIRRVVSYICRAIIANVEKDSVVKDDYHTAQVMYHLLEIVSFCIEAHSHAMKNFITQKQLFGRVVVLLQSRQTFLILATIRFFRRILQLKDEFYNRTFIRFNLLEGLMHCFTKTEHQRYNLVNSALVELFDFIQNESILCLIQELGRLGYLDNLAKQIDYIATFRSMKQRFDAMVRRQPSNNGGGGSAAVASSLRPFTYALASTTGSHSTTTSNSFNNNNTLSGGGVLHSTQSLGNLSPPSAADSHANNGTTGMYRGNSQRFRRDPRALEEEEEMWFSQEDDDDDEEEDTLPECSQMRSSSSSSAVVVNSHLHPNHHHNPHNSHSPQQQHSLSNLSPQDATSSDESEDPDTDEFLESPPPSPKRDSNNFMLHRMSPLVRLAERCRERVTGITVNVCSNNNANVFGNETSYNNGKSSSLLSLSSAFGRCADDDDDDDDVEEEENDEVAADNKRNKESKLTLFGKNTGPPHKLGIGCIQLRKETVEALTAATTASNKRKSLELDEAVEAKKMKLLNEDCDDHNATATIVTELQDKANDNEDKALLGGSLVDYSDEDSDEDFPVSVMDEPPVQSEVDPERCS